MDLKVQAVWDQKDGPKDVTLLEGEAALIFVANNNGEETGVHVKVVGAFDPYIVAAMFNATAETMAKMLSGEFRRVGMHQ